MEQHFSKRTSFSKRVIKFVNSLRGRLILSIIVILTVYLFLSTWYWSSAGASRSLERLAASTYHPDLYDKMLASNFLASRPNLMWKIDYLPANLILSFCIVTAIIFLANITLISRKEAALQREGNLPLLLRYRIAPVNHLASFCRVCPGLNLRELQKETTL